MSYSAWSRRSNKRNRHLHCDRKRLISFYRKFRSLAIMKPLTGTVLKNNKPSNCFWPNVKNLKKWSWGTGTDLRKIRKQPENRKHSSLRESQLKKSNSPSGTFSDPTWSGMAQLILDWLDCGFCQSQTWWLFIITIASYHRQGEQLQMTAVTCHCITGDLSLEYFS